MIADFLKGTVEESLKKLVQPAAVVPATLFVLLNLAFIYPAAKDWGAAKSFAGLDKTWQAVVAGALILAIGYILLNAANSIIELLAGQSWRRSGLNWWLRQHELGRRSKLEERIKAEPRRLGLKWELATHFPLPQRIQATRLGNILVATQQTVLDRYGLDLAGFWSSMEASKELEKAPALIAVKDEKATLDLLANLVLVLTLFGVEVLVFFTLSERWGAALLSSLAFVAGYIAYRIAVESARSWGDAVQVVLDLHRGELRKGLGLREPKDLEDERKLWGGARSLYLPGYDGPLPEDLFKADEPPLELAASSSLKVESVAVAVVDAVAEAPGRPARNGGGGSDTSYTLLLRYVDYLLIATRAKRSGDDGGLDIVVDDSRVRRVELPPPIESGNTRATPAQRRVGGAERLHWRLTNLPRGASLTLGFRLPLWRVTFEGDAPPPTVFSHSDGFEVAFAGGANTTVVVVLETFAPLTDQPRLAINGKKGLMELIDIDKGTFRSIEHQLVGGDKLWIWLPAVST